MTTTQPQPQPEPPQTRTILTHLIHLDKTWSHSLHALSTPTIPRATLKLLELTGDGRLWFPLSISLLLSPLSLHSSSLYTASLSLLLGLISDIAVIGVVKHLVKRPRPEYNRSMGLTFSVDHWSFPSGHSSRVCFISAFCYLSTFDLIDGVDQLRIRKGEIVDRWIGEWESGFVVMVFVTVVCVWSVVTSISRVLFGRHYVFDVAVGAALGVLNALLVYRFLRF